MRTIKVDYLARVEGEGALYVRVKKGVVQEVKLKIFEPPRFFEAFLRDRSYSEVPDITARICGICPIAYQMSSVHALEQAFGVTVDGQLRELRRLIYCGEWIESHTLHVYMLHAPDFLGYQDSIEIARDDPELIRRGLRLKKAGNEIVRTVGGREIHPINVRVGGFYRVPSRRELAPLLEELKWARDAAYETCRWVGKLEFPDFEQDYEFVALRHPSEYPFNEGRLVSSSGLDIDICEYPQHFTELHVDYSNALQSVMHSTRSYFTGPLARYNLNYDRLPAICREAAAEAGLEAVCKNPFKSIAVRSVEILFACVEAIRIIESYEPPVRACVDIQTCAGTGHGCTEAPRGILYHRYTTDASGLIRDAVIIPPTSQNQRVIEDDLRHFVSAHLDLGQEELTWKCEQAVRNYDPCISCATHFLKLQLERE